MVSPMHNVCLTTHSRHSGRIEFHRDGTLVGNSWTLWRINPFYLHILKARPANYDLRLPVAQEMKDRQHN